MSYTAIDSTRYEVAKPVKKDLMQDISLNQADHETRITAVEASASSIQVFNQIIDLESNRVGETKFFMLTQAQINARLNSKWVEIDGSSIAGEDLASLYGATLPDGRGRFPRILDSTRSVGDEETNQTEAHTHIQNTRSGTGTGIATSDTGLGGSYARMPDTVGGGDVSSQISTGSTGSGTETRPDSLVLSAVTKVSETNFEYSAIFRAPSAFALSQLNVSNLIAGSAGTLEVDLLKGSALGSLTSLLTTNLTHSYTTGNYATSANASFASTAIAVNEFIVLDVIGFQSGQDRFFVNCFGTAS